MAESIKDGTGQGYQAKVDATNRIRTRGVVEQAIVESVRDGNAYAIPSGVVVLTSATASAVMHLTNNEKEDIVLTRIICSPIRSVGGTEDFVILASRINGTGLSGGSGNPIPSVNINFGSSNSLDIESEVGAEGAIVTGSPVNGPTFLAEIGRTFETEIYVRIPSGKSISFLITPPPSNTQLLVVVALNGYLEAGVQ